MYFEQFYLNCLAHASYMLGSEGAAVVIDPQRDVDIYLQAASEQGLRIAHIFETHLHADFISGHRELAARTGAQIYIGTAAGAKFPHTPVSDGFELIFGTCRLRVRETPGHTPESICLEIFDPERTPQPWAVLTGDTLFIGDVGRPDLSPTHSPQQLAGMLYDSLHHKLMTLPPGTLVYPAHGAGSLCGRNMRAERHSTIATERATNYALQIRNRDDFVQELTSNLPARPQYFSEDADINREGASALAALPDPPALSPAEVSQAASRDVFILDTRPADAFAAAHVPGAVNIGLGGQFASWAGSTLGLHRDLILVADNEERMREARMRLARVGIERVAGWLSGGMDEWRAAGFRCARLPQITVEELHNYLQNQWAQVLDVRREAEWQAGHIEGAHLHPLDRFAAELPPVGYEGTLAVHCKSGYRSMIAASLLQRAGYGNIVNVIGGYDAWAATGFPVVDQVHASHA